MEFGKKKKKKTEVKRLAIEGAIELGDVARDKVTGFEGVVIGESRWLENCDRLFIQPQKLQSNGEPQKSCTFDRPSCELIEKGTFKPKVPQTGGPEPREVVEPCRDPR